MLGWKPRIRSGTHTITAADRMPGDLREALDASRSAH
jgi:hypothetical protein